MSYLDKSNASSSSEYSTGFDSSSKQSFFRRRKGCPLTVQNPNKEGKVNKKINYKDLDLIGRYTTETGKIMPSRITNVSRKKQSELARAIRIARVLSLLPFSQQ